MFEWISNAFDMEEGDRIAIVSKDAGKIDFFRVGEEKTKSDVQDKIGYSGTVVSIVTVEE